MLPRVAPHRRGRRGHQNRPLAAFLHVRADTRGRSKQRERCHAPTALEHLVARIRERSVADLGPEVEDHDVNRPDVRFHVGHPLLDALGSDRVQQEARRASSLALDVRDRSVQALLVGAPAKDGVISLAGEASCDIAADSGAGADHETDWFHGTAAPDELMDGRASDSAGRSTRRGVRPARARTGMSRRAISRSLSFRTETVARTATVSGLPTAAGRSGGRSKRWPPPPSCRDGKEPFVPAPRARPAGPRQPPGPRRGGTRRIRST